MTERPDDPAILFIKPNAISPADRTTLATAGILVIEIDDPSSVKFTRAGMDIPQNGLLAAASKAIRHSKAATEVFGNSIALLIAGKS